MPTSVKESKAASEALENLKLVLSSPRPKAPDTLRGYLSIAGQFLTWLGDKIPPDDKDVRRYILNRRKEGIKESSLRTVFFVLEKLFKASNWNWPFTKDDRPETPSETTTPAFTREQTEQLITKRHLYTDTERFYLAIATTYAPRRIELARITKRSIKGNTLYIDTAKHGPKTTHLIPEQIMPYVANYKPRQHNVSSLSAIFDRLCLKGLGEKRAGYGWHSFRRTLATLLPIELAKADKPLLYVAHFMRWNQKALGFSFFLTAMAGVYSREEALSPDPFFIDRQVFEVHPFLPLWRA